MECGTCVCISAAVVWLGGWDCRYICVSCESGIFVYLVSLDYLCRWQVQIIVYCAWQIHAHLRYTQCSFLLHLIDICFLPYICLWQISQIQTCLCVVVGPGLVSTLPAFMKCSASHPVGTTCPQNGKFTCVF